MRIWGGWGGGEALQPVIQAMEKTEAARNLGIDHGLDDPAKDVVIERGHVVIGVCDASSRKIETRTLARTARDAAP